MNVPRWRDGGEGGDVVVGWEEGNEAGRKSAVDVVVVEEVKAMIGIIFKNYLFAVLEVDDDEKEEEKTR